jgi:vancomycin resistance protein YoaR
MPANATIGGVDVSGMSPDDARHAVDRELSPHIGDEVELKHDGKDFTIDPKAAGLTFDLDRSIEKAGGNHSWNPGTMAGLLFGTHKTAPAVDADDAKLDGIVKAIAATVDRDVVEPQITFPKGKPTPRQPKAGLVVSRSDTADAVIHAYLVARHPVDVPTAVVEPTVGSEGLEKAMTTIAEPAVSGPVTIKVGNKKVKLPVSAYAPALVVRVKDEELKPEIDAERLAKPLTNSTTGIGKKARDATVKIRNGKAVVVPGKEGIGLQPEEMSKKLVPAITETGDARSVEIEAKVVDPEVTTRDVKKLQIKERVSSFSTFFPYAEYRNINQSRAAELIDGTILKPGETFSMNDQVGERTAANGFVTGTVISGGVFREELGGGVSQVATTTYNAAFFAGMVDVEHHPHAFYISRYPVGREATVYFGNLDLRFKNPTKYGVLIHAYVNRGAPGRQGEMHVELWSTKVWKIKAGLSEKRNFREPGKQYDDTKRCVPQEPIQGFDVDVYRTFMRGGEVVKRETDTARYQAADHVICGKKPKKN